MTLREQITRELEIMAQGTHLMRSTWFDTYTGKEEGVIDVAVARILTLFREAMLSEEALAAAGEAAFMEDYGEYAPDWDEWDEPGAETLRAAYMDDERTRITAALNAIMQEEDQDVPELLS